MGNAPAGRGQADWLKLKTLKRVLGDGTDSGEGAIGPFGFKTPQDAWSRARSAGLEGFFYAKLEHERAWGEKASLAQLDDYFTYLDALLAPASRLGEVYDLRSGLKVLAASPAAPLEKNRELNALLVAGLNLLRAEASSLDKASWGRSAGIYMVLARAYNRLRPGKGFFDSFDEAEFERIRRQTRADTLWLLDIYEIGAPRRWGTGGGSPYSISGYRVKKELGGDEALRRFSERAHKAGMRVMTDFIPNHTSLDSELIKERPEAVLHIVPPQHLTDAEIMAGVPRESFGPRSPVFYLVETDNYPENGRSQDLGGGTSSGHPSVGRRVHKKILVHHPRTDYGDVMWIDMAQIDYSREGAREWEIEQARR
ncbi:MAG: alpha-amylase family glycosyl hydrolase, partial [Elusimicrobiota bacterium]